MPAALPPLDPPHRLLLGPGPSCVPPRVTRALAAPLVGHLDPAFLLIMEEIKELLHGVFQTANRLTLPISGTGSAGMETCLVNLIEPGDRVVIGVHGVFGERMCDVASRCGAVVTRVEAPWGQPLDGEEVAAAVRSAEPSLVAVVHAETSTGVLQPLEAIAAAAREGEALLVVDAVTSLGGMPVPVDALGIDACYSGTQKCLSCPPGLAPVTFSERATARLAARRTPVQSWYLDLTLLDRYWGSERVYHHTAPVAMLYALREALAVIHEEGLEACWQRHADAHGALVRGMEAMGLELVVAPEYRLPSLNTVAIPAGVDDGRVRQYLLQHFGIEIGGGLGAFRGKAWRIGLMGHSARRQHVATLCLALEAALAEQGHRVPRGAGSQAALAG